MKKLTLFTILIFGSLAIQAQDFKGIVSSIQNGDVSVIEPMLDDLIDYCFDEEQDLLEKGEFIAKMKEAIATISPKSSEIIHVADSKNNESQYAVAKLTGASGDEYRMFVYTEGEKIIEIRFNKEK